MEEWRIYLTMLFADGTQVQAHSPVDSAVISGLENDEEPRDEGGMLGMLGMNIVHTHIHTSFTNTCSIMHAHDP